jgi:hypothetical protein
LRNDITPGGVSAVAKKRATRRAEQPPPAPPKRAPVPWPKLSSRHRRTLEALFERPVRSDIPWHDIEALFTALGGSVSAGSGSRRRVKLREGRATFHEPHPERVTDKGAVEDVRDFLLTVGVRPS